MEPAAAASAPMRVALEQRAGTAASPRAGRRAAFLTDLKSVLPPRP